MGAFLPVSLGFSGYAGLRENPVSDFKLPVIADDERIKVVTQRIAKRKTKKRRGNKLHDKRRFV